MNALANRPPEETRPAREEGVPQGGETLLTPEPPGAIVGHMAYVSSPPTHYRLLSEPAYSAREITLLEAAKLAHLAGPKNLRAEVVRGRLAARTIQAPGRVVLYLTTVGALRDYMLGLRYEKDTATRWVRRNASLPALDLVRCPRCGRNWAREGGDVCQVCTADDKERDEKGGGTPTPKTPSDQ